MNSRKICLFIVLLLSGLASYACPACEKQQPKLLRGITHGTGPESQWDYVIVVATVVATGVTLFYSIKWLISPNESIPGHIKTSILNH